MAWLWVWLSPVEMCVSQLLKLPGATLGSGDQMKEKSLHLCVRTTGRPGNLGASCWVEPMSNANSWRAPGYVCACLHAHHCSRAAGLEDLSATEESSSGSRAWRELQDGWSQVRRDPSCTCVFPSNRFILISQSWEED